MPEYDITALYRRHAERLKRYIRRRVYSPEEAEDIVQSVFLELSKPGALSRADKDIDAYVFGVAKHLVAQHLKQKPQRHAIPWDESLEALLPPGESEPPADDIERIYVLLRRLPPKAGEALKLAYLDGLPPKQAAARAGCSERTFCMRLYRAIRGLRDLALEDRGSSEPALRISENSEKHPNSM